MADLDVQVPLTLGELYENASGLVEDYTLRQNQLLAEAAARRPISTGVVAPAIVEPPAAPAGPLEPDLPPSPALPPGNTGTDERGFPVVGRGSGMVSPARDAAEAARRRLASGSKSWQTM